jgi:hypothetical protein
MKSLTHTADRAAILLRLRRLNPETARRWGRMTAPQMVCHLTDSFLGVMGERESRSAMAAATATMTRASWRQRAMKLVALQLPLPWPHGVKTKAEVDQEKGGTPPGDFGADLAALEVVCARFANDRRERSPHFLFGPLTSDEWNRWGYRHMDHHLRQFGL